MAYTYRIDEHLGLGTIAFTDFVTRQDLADAHRRLLDDPAWQPGFACVWDGRAIGTFVLSIDDLLDVAAQAQQHAARRGEGRTAMIVSRELLFQVAGLLAGLMHREHRPVRVFKSMDRAADWLDVGRPVSVLLQSRAA